MQRVGFRLNVRKEALAWGAWSQDGLFWVVTVVVSLTGVGPGHVPAACQALDLNQPLLWKLRRKMPSR